MIIKNKEVIPMKKTLALFLALAMILGCMPAALADDGWITLRVECFDRNAAGFNVEDCMQLRYVQEHFGDPNKIKVEFVSVSRWEETAILNTLLAGQTAPDLCMTYDGSLMQTYIDMGGVYPMDELLETYGQNVKNFLGEGCLMYGINAEDGVRYNLVARRLNVGMLGVFVRGDWLAQLNMEIPTTRQQWIDYLYAARDAKLGGDITLPYAFGFYEANPLWGNSLLVNSYLDWENISEELYLVAGQYKEVLPGAKEAYRLLNQFYHDGIINPDYPLDATDDSNNQKFYLGQVGTKIATYDDPYRADQAYQQEMSKNVPGAYWVPANCMTNKDGYTFHSVYAANGLNIFIPGWVEDEVAVAAMKYLDWMAQPENMFFLQNGVEGVNYEKLNEDGIPVGVKATSDVPDEYKMHAGDVCFLANGSYFDTPEKVAASVALAYAGFEEYVAQAYADQLVDALPGSYCGITIQAETDYAGMVTQKEGEFLTNVITCPADKFDETYDYWLQQILDSGLQQILDERTEAYRNGYLTGVYPAQYAK